MTEQPQGTILYVDDDEVNRRACTWMFREAGFDVRTFPGDEIGINGGGGPTCLTRPILRG